MTRLTLIFLICGLSLCSQVKPVHAAQDVTVVKDNVPVRQDPNSTAKIIDYLQNGDDLRVSSYPVNGEFFKVRAKNGQYGWVQMRYLSMDKKVEEEEDQDKDKGLEPERDRKFALKAFGGFDFFKPQDLNDVFAFNELNNGYNAGGELSWTFGQRISLLFRVEALTKNVVAKESTTGLIYNLSLRSYPIMNGIDFKFIKDAPLRVSVSIYAGLAFHTSFSAQALSLDVPNEVELLSNDFTTLVLANVERPLGRTFSVFASGGYRHLKSLPQDTSNGVNGGQVFNIAGVFVPRLIDLSGILFNVGLAVHL